MQKNESNRVMENDEEAQSLHEKETKTDEMGAGPTAQEREGRLRANERKWIVGK